jgi:hypothetical protein
MESDKFITVCETAAGQVAIIDMSAGNTVTRQKMSAEAAIMNPLSKVIALRGKEPLRSPSCFVNYSVLIVIIDVTNSWSNVANL